MWILVFSVFLFIILFGVATYLFVRDGLFIKKQLTLLNSVYSQNYATVNQPNGPTLQIKYGSTENILMRVGESISVSLDGGNTFPLTYELKSLLPEKVYIFPDGISDNLSVFSLSIQNTNPSSGATFNIWVETSSTTGVPASVPSVAPNQTVQIFTHPGQILRLGTSTFDVAPYIVSIHSKEPSAINVNDDNLNFS
jgi:hypothetical protein